MGKGERKRGAGKETVKAAEKPTLVSFKGFLRRSSRDWEGAKIRARRRSLSIAGARRLPMFSFCFFYCCFFAGVRVFHSFQGTGGKRAAEQREVEGT